MYADRHEANENNILNEEEYSLYPSPTRVYNTSLDDNIILRRCLHALGLGRRLQDTSGANVH